MSTICSRCNAVAGDNWESCEGQFQGECQHLASPHCTVGAQQPQPVMWIIEGKGLVWSTNKLEIAAKHMDKPGSSVTPYYSKVSR